MRGSLFQNFQDKENSEKTKLGKYFYFYNNTINAYKYELNSVSACKRASRIWRAIRTFMNKCNSVE